MLGREVQGFLVSANSSMGIAQRPAGPAFAHTVLQMLSDDEVTHVVLDSCRVVPQKGECVTQGVASLRLHRPILKLLCQLQCASETPQ